MRNLSSVVLNSAGSTAFRRRRGRCDKGVIFLDALAGVFVLALGAAAFFSLYPVVARSEKISRDRSVAGQLASKMSEHLQLLKTTDLTSGSLSGLHLIDDGQYSSPFSFSHIPLDEASDYSPATMLRNGEGWLTISDVAGNSKKITIEIDWTDAAGRDQSFVTGTIIGGYR
jgi:hypothetical protein